MIFPSRNGEKWQKMHQTSEFSWCARKEGEVKERERELNCRVNFQFHRVSYIIRVPDQRAREITLSLSRASNEGLLNIKVILDPASTLYWIRHIEEESECKTNRLETAVQCRCRCRWSNIPELILLSLSLLLGLLLLAHFHVDING